MIKKIRNEEAYKKILKYMESLNKEDKVYINCNKCNLNIHQKDANYCCFCGTKL